MENTTLGIKRNINFYKNVAKETGVNVIAGTGLCTVIERYRAIGSLPQLTCIISCA